MKFSKQMVVAHRGAKGLVKHENTMEAFIKAVEVGADCIEIDIRKTKDNKIVVFHDDAIKGKRVKDLTYQELLEQASFDVPTLEEVLVYVKGKILIDIEFKESGYVEEALDIITKHLTTDEFYIRSFKDDVIVDAKAYDKNIMCALLIGTSPKKHKLRTRLSELFPGRRIKKCGCDFISPYHGLIRFGFMWRMKLLKKPVSVWTVNDENLMRKMLFKKKVHAIVTDYPDKALKILAEKNKNHLE